MDSIKIERHFANELQDFTTWTDRHDRMLVAREYLEYRISRDGLFAVSKNDINELTKKAKVK